MNKDRFFAIFWQLIKYTFLAGGLALIIRGFLLIPVPIEGNSMEGTLKQNDMVVMEKISKVKRFDVIVFESADGKTYVKRVIGMPGDSVSYKDDTLYINDIKVEEPFLERNLIADQDETIPFTYDFAFEELMGVKKLGKNSYFVMGDNRRVSKDSRSFGAITTDNIIGKARFVYYPLKNIHFI